MAGGTRDRPRRTRGAAACVLTLAILGAGWWSFGASLDSAASRPGASHHVTRHPTAVPGDSALTHDAAHTTDNGVAHHRGPHSPPRTGRSTNRPTRLGTVTGGPPRRPGKPTSNLPQTSGAAATLLLSALAILSLSAAYRVASAADRRERYHPRHRARTARAGGLSFRLAADPEQAWGRTPMPVHDRRPGES